MNILVHLLPSATGTSNYARRGLVQLLVDVCLVHHQLPIFQSDTHPQALL